MRKITYLLIMFSVFLGACGVSSSGSEYTAASEELAYNSAMMTLCINAVVDPDDLSSEKAYTNEDCIKMVDAMKAVGSYKKYKDFLRQAAPILTQSAATPEPAGPQG